MVSLCPDCVTVLLFKADWCGYCKNFEPLYKRLEQKFPKVHFVEFEETANKDEIKQFPFEIAGYPTIVLLNPSNIDQPYLPYKGPRTEDALSQFIMDGNNSKDDDVQVVLVKAEWCGFCQRFAPVFSELKQKLENEHRAFVILDEATNKDQIRDLPFVVKGYPTIALMDSKKEKYKTYRGTRSKEDVQKFIMAGLGSS